MTGISPLANMPTLFAWQASLPIFGRGKRTRITLRFTRVTGSIVIHSKNQKAPFMGAFGKCG